MVATSVPSMPAEDMRGLGRLHMDRMADEDEDPNLREGIKYPGKHDVMLGRGGESTYHCGNIAFRQLVEDHKTKYYTAPRAHKSRVVAEVVRKWRELTPPGRFLTRTNPGDGDKSAWHDVGDSRALKKASHSLRDAVRCFSVEKKQRQQAEEEQQQQQQRQGRTSATEHEDRATFLVQSTCPEASGGRKRSRAADFFLSSSRIGGNRLSRELELVSTKRENKQKLFMDKLMAAPGSALGTTEQSSQRPFKRQRAAVCDTRDEEQQGGGDCHRRRLDNFLLRGGCFPDQEIGQETTPAAADTSEKNKTTTETMAAADPIPSSISWDRQQPKTRSFGDLLTTSAREPSRNLRDFLAAPAKFSVGCPSPPSASKLLNFGSFSSSPKTSSKPLSPLSFLGRSSSPKPQQQRRSQSPARVCLSPCGSADWFSPLTEGLPVKASATLPTADVLVQEVVVSEGGSDTSGSNSPIGRNGAPPATTNGASDDEDSLGWFSDGERGMAAFTADPLFDDEELHRPFAVPSALGSGSNPASGQEQ